MSAIELGDLLNEPVQTIEAIRNGEVDAFVVADSGVDRVYVLQAADLLYREIVETMGEGAVTLSQDGALTYCNPYFVGLLGRDRNELLGRPLRGFVAAGSAAVFDALLRGAADRAEIELETADGPVPVSISSTALRDAGGSQFCLVVNDLRDARAREQLRAAKEAAELANKTKDDFLAMVSHELRSPITVILGWIRMLQMNRVDRDTLTLAVDSMHHSTARLLKLVEDILDASRLSSGKVTLEPAVVDLRDAVRASMQSVRFEAEQKPLHVALTVADQPVPVRADVDRLQQVVVNLLANAVKFTPPHGRIEVDVTEHGGAARLHVRDSGEGIDPSFLPFVFERFRQDDSSTTRAHKGLGLGLAIVKQLVEAHGGSVTAASDGKGHGAAFTVMLPLTSDAQEKNVVSNEALPSLDGVRVLLVDDEADTVDVMRSILQSAGAEVQSASSVTEALARTDEIVPHVVVSDIAMPGQDGLQFVRRLAADVPAIALTGTSGASDRETILNAGFRKHLRKPVEPAELIKAVHALTRGESR